MSAARVMREREALVFDLDGTLVDSAGDIRATLDQALRDCGIVGVAANDLVDLHSPLEDIVRDALTRRGQGTQQADAVVAAYRQRLAQSRYERSAPYPGVAAFLAHCVQRGQRLGVCTNKSHGGAIRMLAHFDLLKYFDSVVGSDSAHSPKPAAAPLQLSLRELGTTAPSALLVGDTHVDALCAHHAGVDFVWYSAGYGQPASPAPAPLAAFGSWQGLGVQAALA